MLGLDAHGIDKVDGAISGQDVVTRSPAGHHRSGVDFEDTMFERRPYDKWVAYGQSKTANVLFAVGQARIAGTANELNLVIKADTINLRSAGRRADWGHEYATLLKSERIL